MKLVDHMIMLPLLLLNACDSNLSVQILLFILIYFVVSLRISRLSNLYELYVSSASGSTSEKLLLHTFHSLHCIVLELLL